MDKINESQASDLLMNMYNFYKKRYASNQTEMEQKFNDAVEDLIATGDISKAEYMNFCVTHDIEPKVKKKSTSSSSSSSSSYTGDSCGGGGGYRRGGC
jgi:hypothetical protein